MSSGSLSHLLQGSIKLEGEEMQSWLQVFLYLFPQGASPGGAPALPEGKGVRSPAVHMTPHSLCRLPPTLQIITSTALPTPTPVPTEGSAGLCVAAAGRGCPLLEAP